MEGLPSNRTASGADWLLDWKIFCFQACVCTLYTRYFTGWENEGVKIQVVHFFLSLFPDHEVVQQWAPPGQELHRERHLCEEGQEVAAVHRPAVPSRQVKTTCLVHALAFGGCGRTLLLSPA